MPDTGSLQKDLTALARATHDFHSSEKGKDIVTMLLGCSRSGKAELLAGTLPSSGEDLPQSGPEEGNAPQENWRFYLDLFIAPWYFCTWKSGTMAAEVGRTGNQSHMFCVVAMDSIQACSHR